MTDKPDVVDPTATPEDLVSGFKKDELAAAAEVHGVDVAKGDTKQDIAEKIVQAKAVVPPIHVDQFTKRNDKDAVEGTFAKVVKGEHAGQIGVFLKGVEFGTDGYPTSVLLRIKDASYSKEYVTVPYENVRTVRGY